jgi:hypothetical protein
LGSHFSRPHFFPYVDFFEELIRLVGDQVEELLVRHAAFVAAPRHGISVPVVVFLRRDAVLLKIVATLFFIICQISCIIF